MQILISGSKMNADSHFWQQDQAKHYLQVIYSNGIICSYVKDFRRGGENCYEKMVRGRIRMGNRSDRI